MFRSDLFKEASKSRAPSNLALQILCFIGVFIVSYIFQGIVVIAIALPMIMRKFNEIGVFSGEYEFDLEEIYNISAEITTDPKIMLATLFTTAFVIVCSIIFCLLIAKRSARSMGMTLKKAPASYLTGALLGGVLITLILGLSALFGANRVVSSGTFDTKLIILFFIGFLIQGAAEEFIFRGYLMTELGGKHSAVTALAVSSIAFALAHGLNPGISFLAFFNLTLFAVFAGLYIILTENIWGACAIHSLWNFTQGNVWGISVSGSAQTNSVFTTEALKNQPLLTGGKFGIEGSICTTIVLGIATVIVCVLLIKKNKKL